VIRRHPILSVLTGVYLGGLAWVTLTPMPFDTKRDGLIAWSLHQLHQVEMLRWVTFDGLDSVAKALIFVPFGLLLVLLAGRRRWVFVVFLGLITSCWIELAQNIWIPSRSADARDVMANTGGALLGAIVAVAILGATSKRRKRSRTAARSSLTPVSQSPGSRL